MQPVVYVHKWWHDYLETSIKQTLKNNKDVILIGDEKNEFVAKKYNITHVMFDEYNHNDFDKYYVHNKKNTNYQFELFCFQRWLVLLEVMKKLDISKCVYLDSDILYYWNIDKEISRISKFWNFDLAFPNLSWHTTYVFSRDALKKFCDFMINHYKDKKLYDRLLKWPLIWQPWISDMTIFQLYINDYPDKVYDLTKDYWDNIVYDDFINWGSGYKTYFGKKDFIIKSNKVYFKNPNWSKVETKTLHFQMHMKTYMWIVYDKKIFLYKLLLLWNYCVEWLYFKVPFIRVLRKKRKDKHLF